MIRNEGKFGKLGKSKGGRRESKGRGRGEGAERKMEGSIGKRSEEEGERNVEGYRGREKKDEKGGNAENANGKGEEVGKTGVKERKEDGGKMERAKAKGRPSNVERLTRGRSNSEVGMEEFINRKRKERDENRELMLESEGLVFKRSTMTNRSPLKGEGECRNCGRMMKWMEEIRNKMEEMGREMRRGREDKEEILGKMEEMKCGWEKEWKEMKGEKKS